ncbi:MAG: hypothetical protein ACR2PL_14035, partial [Dehalococcoidia bacterium]
MVGYDGGMTQYAAAQKPPGLYAGLFLGVFAVSVAALLIRLASAPPLSVASYRLVLAAIPVALAAVWKRRPELRGLE